MTLNEKYITESINEVRKLLPENEPANKLKVQNAAKSVSGCYGAACTPGMTNLVAERGRVGIVSNARFPRCHATPVSSLLAALNYGFKFKIQSSWQHFAEAICAKLCLMAF